MSNSRHAGWSVLSGGVLAAVSLLTVGCPVDGVPTDPDAIQTAYDRGFTVGFAVNSWYWSGYDDGYDTVDFTPVYYQGDTIPYVENPPYDAGYWDGVWYAYNDGYFVDYRYAFILGFSEGYDNAYWPDYLDFLANDVHVEYRNGGWADGYNDGFSEGRVFGANDYEQQIAFDWEDALADYENNVDLYFEEVDVGTGAYGPVVLYEYGTDPHTLKSLLRPNAAMKGPSRAIRRGEASKEVDLEGRELYRALSTDAAGNLNVAPETSKRNEREIRLTTTWRQRLDSYLSGSKSLSKRVRARQVTQD